jgi:hypothetical protein
MRPLRPIDPVRRNRLSAARRLLPFTADSDLGEIILHMLTTQSLAAFTPAIGRADPALPARGATPAASVGGNGRAEVSAAPQRPLDMVPPQPGRPMPRGSLLDLRV